MNIVLGTLELTTIGGVGTYLLTVAEQLERMGHNVTIHTEEKGDMAALAAGRGLRVATDPGELPERCDAVYAQDAPSAYLLADRYRDVPRACCLHATEYHRWVVPQVPGVIAATVTLHDRAARYARCLGHVPDVVRLRQPVDLRLFAPRGGIAATPRRALLLGNYVSGNRLELIRKACSETGIALVERGLQGGGFVSSPDVQMNESDFVIGKSRVIVEAMACGRAAYVYDHNGGDGWVTPERYPALEADNFDGQADARPVDPARLRSELRAYRREMGPANRDLAVAHHGARSHCEALVDLFRRIATRSDAVTAPLDELARLARAEWRSDARAMGFEHEAKLLRAQAELAHQRIAELEAEAAASADSEPDRSAVGGQLAAARRVRREAR